MPLTAKRVLRQFRYAMYFNGVNNYIINRDFVWNVQQTGLTVGITLNTLKYSRNDWFGHASSQTLRGYFELQHRADWSAFALEITSTDTGEGYATGTTGKYPPSVFHSVYLTWDGNYFCWYVNGLLDNCRADTRTDKSMAFIGYSLGKSTFYAQGYMSQALFYTRPLSVTEIQWNYQNHDKPIRNGLVLWLQAHPDNVKDIDGDGRLEWIDLSGFGNHGKIYGAQLVQLTKPPARILTPARVLSPVR